MKIFSNSNVTSVIVGALATAGGIILVDMYRNRNS